MVKKGREEWNGVLKRRRRRKEEKYGSWKFSPKTLPRLFWNDYSKLKGS